ncbi:hypothetical protein ACJX0J_025918, partial [Zea mays]
AAEAEALLQQALNAIQNLNAEKGVGVSGQQVQAGGASSGGDKSKPVPLIEITKKKEGQDDQGLGAKANAKAHCHRCFAKGHVISGCTVELFCEVIEGEIGGANVTMELERLLPGGTPWVVEQIDPKTFKTVFPSAAELMRMIEWGPVKAKSQKATLEFKANSAGGELRLMLTSVIDPQAILISVDVEIDKIIYEVHLWVEGGSTVGVPMTKPEESFVDEDGKEEGDDGEEVDLLDDNHVSGNNQEKEAEGNGGNNSMYKEGNQHVQNLNGEEGVCAADVGQMQPSQAVDAEVRNTPDCYANKVWQLAAIPEVVQAVASGRKRRSGNTDEHSLVRAERLKAKHNG